MSEHFHQGFLDECRNLYEAGNKWCLMQAIYACAMDREPMPDWVAEEYIKAFEAHRTAKVRSWDEVFGSPHTKGTHYNAAHKRLTLMWPVFNRIQEILELNPATVIDEYLFESVGRDFGLGKTLTSEFYYEAKRLDAKYS